MSEGYDDSEDISADAIDSGGDPLPGALSVTPGQSAGDTPSDSPLAALRAATARLKAQRSGLSTRQQIGALLMGFATPSAHSGWQSGVVNAAQALQARELAQQKIDQQRNDLITKYDLASAHYQAQNQAAAERTRELAEAARLRAQASTDKAAKGTIQVLPALYPGATQSAVLKGFNPDGTPFVRPVPIGTPGSVPATPADASTAATAPSANPFPVKHGTGAELAAKYGITGLTPTTNYSLQTAGPDAGKVTEDKTEDYLSQYGGATGASLLQQLPESDRAQVEAIAKGKVAPPTAGTRSPAAQRILALASAAYPGVDFAKNYRTTIDYASSGKAGQNIIKGGTAIDHAVKAYDSIEALGNVDAGVFSGLINGIKNAATASNNPAVKDFRVNRDLFAKELEAAVKGSGNASNLTEFKEWQKELSDADSPEVMKSVLRRGVGMLGDRLQNQVQPYNDTIGTNRSFLSWLPPGAQQAFIRINPDYTLTDDDKAFMLEQEKARRQRTAAPKAQSAPAASTGGTKVPSALMAQYLQVPQANRSVAKQRLRAAGYDTSGLP